MKIFRLFGILLILAAAVFAVGAWLLDAPGFRVSAANAATLASLPSGVSDLLVSLVGTLVSLAGVVPAAVDLGGRVVFGAGAAILLILALISFKLGNDDGAWENRGGHRHTGKQPQVTLVDVPPDKGGAPAADADANANANADADADADAAAPKPKPKKSAIFSRAKPAVDVAQAEDQAKKTAHDISQLVQWEQISITEQQAHEVVQRMYPDLVAWIPSFRGEALQAFAYRMIAIARNRLKLRDKTISPYQFSTFQNRVYQLEEEVIGKQYAPANPDKVPAERKKDIGGVIDIKTWPEWQQELLAEKEDWKDISIKVLKETPPPGGGTPSSDGGTPSADAPSADAPPAGGGGSESTQPGASAG